MADSVGVYNIEIIQGSDKNITLIVKDDDNEIIDLDGYDAKMQFRIRKKDKQVLDELSTDNSRIEITGVEGKIVLKFPSVITSKYRFITAFYDLEIYSGSQVKRIIEGSVSVNQEVTIQ